MKKALSVITTAVVFSATAATWTGGGDGTSWGDAQNWGGTAPGTTEAVSIDTGSSALTINLGSSDRECGAIAITGTAKLTFSGTGAIKFTSFRSTVATDVNVPATLKTGNNSITVKSTVNFNEDVTSLGTKTVTFYTVDNKRSGRVNFQKTFTGTGTTITLTMGDTGGKDETPVHFYGVLTVAKLQCGRGYKNGYCHLHASNNVIGYVDVAYSGIVCDAENVFPDDLCLTWNNYYRENSANLFAYDFMGHDQVAGGITNSWVDTAGKDECRYLKSTGGAMTLTLKGRHDCYANCYVYTDVSIVWDPVGDYTQEFALKASTTTGSLRVKRGRIKVSDNATFAKLTGITIDEDATFDLDSGKSEALKELLQLNIAAGGKLKIASTCPNAMSKNSCTAHIAEGGEIQSDADLTLTGVIYNGSPVSAGTYGPSATPAAWATGAGTITVFGGGEVTNEKRYWTGLGDGVTWDQDANWDTKAPATLDSAFFTNNATITSPVVIDGPRTIYVTNGCTVHLSGTVSGMPDITKEGQGFLTLTGSNTFSGTLFIKKGCVTARGDCALGDNASGKIDLSKQNDNFADNLILGGVTVRKELIIRNIDDASNNYKRQLLCEDNTVNTILGCLNVPNAYLRSYTGTNAKFIIAGGGTFSTAQFFDLGSGGEVIVTNSPITKKIYNDANTSGWLTFSVAGNAYSQWNTDHDRGMKNHVRTTVNGAFSSSSYFYFGGTGLLDLCGTTQSLSRIEALTKSTSNWEPASSGTIKSDLPALLTFNYSSAFTNSAIYTGGVSLEQAGAGTVYLTAASTSTGDLIASAGRISFWPSAKWNGNIVMNGGALDVPGPGAFGAEASLALKGGTLTLPAGEYSFVAATDANGDPIAPGRYSSAASGDVQALEGLAGPGVITILPPSGTDATYVWTGAGDGRFSTAANWDGNELPDFQNMNGRYVFPGNGFTATIDTNMYAKSFEFPSGVEDNAKLLASGAGEVTFVDGSIIVTSETAVAKSVIFDVPVKYSKSLKARVGDPAVLDTRLLSLVFSNKISTVGQALFTKDGCGAVRVVGDDNSINGDIYATNGFFYVCGANPLGGSGKMYYRQKGEMQTYSKFVLDNATVARDVTCYQNGDKQTITSTDNSTNLVLGKVSNSGGHFRIAAGTGSVITFAGGAAPDNFLIMQGSGYCVITNTPIVSDKTYWCDDESDRKNVIACAGNSLTGGNSWTVYNTLELTADYAIASNNKIILGSWFRSKPIYGKVDLTDTLQNIAYIYRTVSTNADGTAKYVSAGRVDGLAGSRLKVSGSQTTQILPTFTGAASFEHAGTATRHLRNSCTSTGELSVVSGTLVMDAPGAAYYGVAQPTDKFEGGSWAGLKLTLSGGEVQVNHSKAFARHASLFIPYGSTGVMNLASGVMQPMEFLYLEDENGEWKRQRIGKWGSNESDAPNKSARFAGAGVMNFLGDGKGTMLLFK